MERSTSTALRPAIAYADFLIGVPSNFTQSSGQPFYLRNRYLGLYAQDSWRARSDLTINAGLRWDMIMPFWEKYNQLQTWVPRSGVHALPWSVARAAGGRRPLGFLRRLRQHSTGILRRESALPIHRVSAVGSCERSSEAAARAAFAQATGSITPGFRACWQALCTPVPPFGYNYLSPGPPLFATPFITAASGLNNGQRFPFPFPPHHVSASLPGHFGQLGQLCAAGSGSVFLLPHRAPYIDNYMFSIQRQITLTVTLLTVSYVKQPGPPHSRRHPGEPRQSCPMPQPSRVRSVR